MATRLTVQINTSANKNDGESRRSECVNAADVLMKIAAVLVSTHATSGTVTDRNGLAHTFTYVPTAAV
jgi:hypothetical protein